MWKAPALTAVTVHLNVLSLPGGTLPSAQVFTSAVSPPEGAASLASGKPPIDWGRPLTTKIGRLGSARSGAVTGLSNPFGVAARVGVVLLRELRITITRSERLASFCFSGKLARLTSTL